MSLWVAGMGWLASCNGPAPEPLPHPSFVYHTHPTDSTGWYLCEIFVQTDDVRIKLDELINCDTTVKDKSLLSIGAIDYAIGQWADYELIYALIPDSSGWHIAQRYTKGPVPDTAWHTLARLDAQGRLVVPPWHVEDLVGFYVAKQNDSTLVLFLGLKGGLLEGQLFRLPNLPPLDRFHHELRRYLPQPIGAVLIFPWEATCRASVGACSLEALPSGKWRIRFENPLGHPLIFEPLEVPLYQ